MKEDLGGNFGFVLLISFLLLVCVSAVATFYVLRARFKAGPGAPDGWLLELVWVNMPLSLVIALVFGWLFFQDEPGFAADNTIIRDADDDRPYLLRTIIFPEAKSQNTLRSRQSSIRYNLRYPHWSPNRQ